MTAEIPLSLCIGMSLCGILYMLFRAILNDIVLIEKRLTTLEDRMLNICEAEEAEAEEEEAEEEEAEEEEAEEEEAEETEAEETQVADSVLSAPGRTGPTRRKRQDINFLNHYYAQPNQLNEPIWFDKCIKFNYNDFNNTYTYKY